MIKARPATRRIGSAGALQDYVNLSDIIIAMSATTDSNYAEQYEMMEIALDVAVQIS